MTTTTTASRSRSTAEGTVPGDTNISSNINHISNINNSNRSNSNSNSTKDVWILRHGQARHNPRAEAARANGCTHEQFLEFMRLDDCLDAPLTRLGRLQAQQQQQLYANTTANTAPSLVISSPLTRALQTAELVLGYPTTFAPPDEREYEERNQPSVPVVGSSSSSTTTTTTDATTLPTPPTTTTPPTTVPPTPPRLVCYEGFREISGWLLNGQRHDKTELQRRFPRWNFDALVTEHDALWHKDTLEDKTACGQRGRASLRWVATHCPESSVLIVTHGAILNAMLSSSSSSTTESQSDNDDDNNTTATNTNDDVRVQLRDGRTTKTIANRSVHQRYDNCELRRYQMQYTTTTSTTEERSNDATTTIVLTEIDLDHAED